MANGWYNESRRHSLASKGIKTANNNPTQRAMSFTKWDGSTDSGSEWAKLRREGMSHDEAVAYIEGRKVIEEQREIEFKTSNIPTDEDGTFRRNPMTACPDRSPSYYIDLQKEQVNSVNPSIIKKNKSYVGRLRAEQLKRNDIAIQNWRNSTIQKYGERGHDVVAVAKYIDNELMPDIKRKYLPDYFEVRKGDTYVPSFKKDLPKDAKVSVKFPPLTRDLGWRKIDSLKKNETLWVSEKDSNARVRIVDDLTSFTVYTQKPSDLSPSIVDANWEYFKNKKDATDYAKKYMEKIK